MKNFKYKTDKISHSRTTAGVHKDLIGLPFKLSSYIDLKEATKGIQGNI